MMRLLAALAASSLLALCGCKADPPWKVETQVMTFAKHHVFIGNRDEKNPLPNSSAVWKDGQEAFNHYCVACHGSDGQNADVPFANHISPPIPSLASADVQAYTDGQLKWILDNGISPSGMPGSKGTLSDDELWSIIVFLRRLPAAGSQGSASMYNR